MTLVASQDLLDGLRTRRGQLRLRLAIGLAVAACFGLSLGWPFVGAWLAAWYLIQGLEAAWLRRALARNAAGTAVSLLPPLALVVATNLVFNVMAARAVLTGEPWIMMAGVWLLTGALLNAVAMSRASNAVFLAGVAPTVLTCAAVVAEAVRDRAPAEGVLAVTAGAVLLFIAAVVLRRLSLEAYLEARRASEAKGQFLANMSHEIRTPLNGVLGMVKVMQTEPLEPGQRERLAVIERSGQALLSILNDILDQSKITAGKLELIPAPFDLEALVSDLREVFGALCADKDVILEAHVAPAARGAWTGDVLRLRQVLSNLLSNAVKFTEHGAVRLAADAADGELRLIVSDSGVGIAPDRLPHVFDTFVQADASITRAYGGTGLGLTICRDLVELMGGRITVESRPGEGTTFSVALPLTRAAEAAPSPPLADDTPEARGLRALVAEDHRVNQLVLQLLLQQLGVQATIVDDGAQALARWREGGFDLVILDVQMPVMDGVSAALAIRREEAALALPPTPIIALTGNALPHQVEAYRRQMNAVVAKPVELPKLAAALTEVMNHAERQAAAHAAEA
ncbi:ATP-binding protein [Phenylobacterium sp.]|jgi:signal transduction histidine kinase/AmiR/NasT family two-component response regulator|uniref:ATP-binding protein n=1 Tax=Phenylobacterium sp. TaxID=1871053 RepID=UPI002F950E10